VNLARAVYLEYAGSAIATRIIGIISKKTAPITIAAIQHPVPFFPEFWFAPDPGPPAGAPQFGQKTLSSGICDPHFEQNIPNFSFFVPWIQTAARHPKR